MTLLEALYRGKLPAFSEIGLWNDEYTKLVSQIAEVETALSEISPEASHLVSQFEDLQTVINSITLYHEFRIGFQMGAQLMMEMNTNLTQT